MSKQNRLSARAYTAPGSHPTSFPPLDQLDLWELQRRRSLTNRVIVLFLFVWGVDCAYDLTLGGTAALPTLVLGLLAIAIAYTFNSFGQATVAGIVLVASIYALYLLPSLTVGAVDLHVFFISVEAVLVAAIVLPPISVFVVAAVNITTMIALAFGASHDLAVSALVVSGQVARTIEQAIGLNVLVASLAYLWVRSVERAIARMDRAELVARLHEVALAQKQALEAEVAHLLDVHVRVANGDLDARAQMQKHHALWMVGGALNNLLTRYQGMHDVDLRLHATERAVANLTRTLQHMGHAPASQGLAWMEPSGTAVDALLEELRRH
jgi:hypothetical protein